MAHDGMRGAPAPDAWKDDAGFDGLLRASLGVPEEPAPEVQAALLAAVRDRAAERDASAVRSAAARGSSEPAASPVPWWVISLAGVLQAATAALGVGVLHPGTFVSSVAGVAGLLMAACAVTLPVVACGGHRRRPKEVHA